MTTYTILKDVGDNNYRIVKYNIFKFLESFYDYASNNIKYKPHRVDIALYVFTKPNMEFIPIMYSYSFSKDIIPEHL
jgi:hypothetical protein